MKRVATWSFETPYFPRRQISPISQSGLHTRRLSNLTVISTPGVILPHLCDAFDSRWLPGEPPAYECVCVSVCGCLGVCVYLILCVCMCVCLWVCVQAWNGWLLQINPTSPAGCTGVLIRVSAKAVLGCENQASFSSGNIHQVSLKPAVGILSSLHIKSN